MSATRGDSGRPGWPSRRLHFVGMGGAGMSGLALVCLRLGAEVTGSDREDSVYMEGLRDAGLEPVVGHDAANVPEGGEVVVSTAIPADNPELEAARERGLSILHRGELLAQLCEEKRLIAVAGTHGKTTTCAMIVWAMQSLGAEPSFFVGGEVPGLGPNGETANAGWAAGDWVVAEADESDASFLRLRPEVAVVTNVELDHHSRWGSLAELRAAFGSFMAPAAAVALPAADPELERLISRATGPENASGVDSQREAQGQVARTLAFDPATPGPEELSLAVPGHHNLLNARAALGALELAGLDTDAAAVALKRFPGVHRRLELKGECNGACVYDDYGHHPTEVRAALEALRGTCRGRLVAVFQPHLFSRTKALAWRFGAALAIADEVIVLDVYPAREKPVGELAGVDGKLVADAASEWMGGRPVCWAPTIEQALRAARRRLTPGDVVVTIGAGDVFRLAERLVGQAEERVR